MIENARSPVRYPFSGWIFRIEFDGSFMNISSRVSNWSFIFCGSFLKFFLNFSE